MDTIQGVCNDSYSFVDYAELTLGIFVLGKKRYRFDDDVRHDAKKAIIKFFGKEY